jgi:predicted HAD superfamily hydrolase
MAIIFIFIKKPLLIKHKNNVQNHQKFNYSFSACCSLSA